MSRTLRKLTVCLAVALATIGVGAAVGGAQQSIGPDQHFIGLVNGSNVDPVVYTVCPGPARPGQMGSVLGGQTMSVAEVASGGGFTGLFSQVYAWFVPVSPTPTASTPTSAPVQLKFTTYGTPQAIPSTVRVPCDGTGTAEFSSCPYLAPCAFGWVPDYVKVRFENIAV